MGRCGREHQLGCQYGFWPQPRQSSRSQAAPACGAQHPYGPAVLQATEASTPCAWPRTTPSGPGWSRASCTMCALPCPAQAWQHSLPMGCCWVPLRGPHHSHAGCQAHCLKPVHAGPGGHDGSGRRAARGVLWPGPLVQGALQRAPCTPVLPERSCCAWWLGYPLHAGRVSCAATGNWACSR